MLLVPWIPQIAISNFSYALSEFLGQRCQLSIMWWKSVRSKGRGGSQLFNFSVVWLEGGIFGPLNSFLTVKIDMIVSHLQCGWENEITPVYYDIYI